MLKYKKRPLERANLMFIYLWCRCTQIRNDNHEDTCYLLCTELFQNIFIHNINKYLKYIHT